MNGRDLGDGVADAQPEYLPDVRGGVGTDQQDLLSRPGQGERSGTRNGGLAHPSFAGEEEEPGRVVQELHVAAVLSSNRWSRSWWSWSNSCLSRSWSSRLLQSVPPR